MPHLQDMLLNRDEVLDEMAGLAIRFEDVDTPEGREKLAGMFSRWDQLMRSAPGPNGKGPEPLHSLLFKDETGCDTMHDLCVFMLRTGRLRNRAEREDLAGCLVHLVEMFVSPRLPDELWDRHLDDRTVHPSNRLRALSKVFRGVEDPALDDAEE